ncbi:MAG: VanZ family protein [Flavobacteriales bacterium]
MLKIFRWALLWALCILVLCLIPGQALPEWDWFSLLDLDKLVHAGMFGVLAVLLADALRKRDGLSRYVLMGCLLSIAYGVATELMQGLEAMGRRTDPSDVVANTVGALIGVLYVRWRQRAGKAIVPVAFMR